MTQNYNIVANLARTAKEYPESLAISVGKSEINYQNFVRSASRLASAILPHLKSGRVGILGSRSIGAYIGIVGACWAGATYVPLNLKWPASRLIKLMGELELDAIVVDSNGAKLLTPEILEFAPKAIFKSSDAADIEGSICLDDLGESTLSEPVHRDESETGYIVFTSGTTGEPKGVVVSCGSLNHYLNNTETWTEFHSDDRIAEAHDVTFDLSVHNMFLAWRVGASLHLMSQLDMMAPQAFIRRREITAWMSVPTIINNMRGNNVLKPDLFPSLRLSVFCGEPLPIKAVQEWAEAAPNSVVENIYGPTEGTVVCTRQRLTDPALVTEKRQILAIGPAYPNFKINICDPSGVMLPDGETGEIVISSVQLSDGYFNRPEQTAEKFKMIDGERWYFTGDLGYRDENKVFHHMGRTDNQVKLKGNRIELEEVEMHLRKACLTDLATVVAWPIVDGSAQGLVGFSTNMNVPEADVKAAMKRTLPEYMVPAQIILREELPRNINDKVDRNALSAELNSASIVPSIDDLSTSKKVALI